MARQEINLGTAPTGIGGDTTRSTGIKINAMTTELYARQALLGTASNANVGTASGNVMPVGAFGLGAAARYVTTNPDSSSIGSGFNYYDDQSGGTSQANGRFGIKFSFGSGLNQGFELLAQPWSNKLYFRYSSVSAGAPWYAPLEIYHTGNTTRGSGGALSAASPILRIADISQSQRRDLQEQTFEPAGEWGVANDEARGVQVQRTGVGEYRVTGSLGLALEGWRTHDPSSPDGGRMLGITDSHQGDDGTVTVRLFKQRWTLTDDGEMVPGRGAAMDVPLNSWIDVRLEMPKAESPPPMTVTEE